MIVLLLTYVIINIAATIKIAFIMQDITPDTKLWWLIVPVLLKKLDESNLNLAGQIVACITFTLFCLPALLINLLAEAFLVLIYACSVLFELLFIKKGD